MWDFFPFQLYYPSETKALPLIWPKSCSLALCGSSCDEAKCQGPAKRSCLLGTFYCLHVYIFLLKKKKAFGFITSCNETVAKKRFFYFLPLKSKSFISLTHHKVFQHQIILKSSKTGKEFRGDGKKYLKYFYNGRFHESNLGRGNKTNN